MFIFHKKHKMVNHKEMHDLSFFLYCIQYMIFYLLMFFFQCLNEQRNDCATKKTRHRAIGATSICYEFYKYNRVRRN